MELLIIVGCLCVAGVFWLCRSKNLTLSQAEQLILSTLVAEEQKALADFTIGKEDIIAEYEALKSRLTNLVSLQTKLPTNQIITNSPVVQAQAQASAPTVGVQQVVADAQEATAPIVTAQVQQ